MGAEGSGIILTREEWDDLKLNGKKKLLIRLICLNTLVMILFSMFVNIIVASLYKIKPNLYQIILVFGVQPIFLATIYTFIEIYFTCKFNVMIYDLKEKDSQGYKRYFIKKNIFFNLIVCIIFFINLQSLTNLSILGLIGLSIGVITVSIIMAISKPKTEFNDLHGKIIEKINQMGNK